ncbi:MAG: hypothetical protein OXC48_05980, partial [Endozoicomonadaceae bacterium]|nr:hypothetical protein [Endozoicomonadaceae bacterium]
KYHLLIDAKIVSDRTNHLLTEVHDFFCNTTESDGCAQSKFADLPATYSLPLKIVTRNQGENSGPPATEITEQQYDSQGRLVSTTDAYGRMEKITYCPTEGDNSCPAEPSDWSLSTQVESVTQYPSYKVPGSLKLPLIVQHNYYKKELNISGNGYILVLASKTIKSGNQYTEIKQEYYNDPQDTFKYGLLKGTTVTGTTSSLSTFHSVTKHYYYILNANHTTKTVYGAIKLESGQFKRSAAVITSLFTNQTIENVDTKNTKVTRYHYDHWGRIIQVDSNADTIFSTSTHYIYRISPQHIQLIVTNSHGLSKKIIFDGAGRQLKIFTEAISEKGKALPGIWLPVTSMDYDAYGRVISQHAYHLDTSKKIYPLTTTFDYDLLGRVNKIHSPNKETAVKMYDDPDRCTVSFEYDAQNHYSPVLITHGNILDKPIEQMVIPTGFIHDYSSAGSLCKISNTTPAARVSYVTYDGFGRKISFTDPAGKKVTITYDDAGRVKNTIDPSGNQFHNVYNFYGQSIQKWITPANSKTQYLLASAQYNIEGALLWKTGEDGKKTTFTYTPENQIATVTMPSGHVISWKYNVIGLPVSKYVDGKESVRIDYDSATTLPVEKREITGITHWTYSDDGRIQQLDHTGENGYPDYHFSWQYDYNKNVISATDLMGNKISTDYDLLGRINAINYHESDGKTKLLKMLTYDGFSRIVKINYGSNMQSNLNYNQYGQTESVTDILADKPLSTWQYSYDKEGNITTLIHNAEDNQQAILHYKYDIANNLVAMNCSGSSGLSLCPRDTSFRGSGLKHAPVIISQNYSFNALNRMQQVKESLLNTSLQKTANKIIHYSYGYQQAPLRLKQITTQWSNNATPITANFVYDTTGNMTVDSEGNKINYNIFNQITEVLTPNGKQTHYFYDGGGREVREVTDTGNIRNLFYVGKHLLNEQISQLQQSTHTISYLGVGKAIDGMIHEYYQQNYKGDVTGVLIKTKQDHYILSQKNIYSPYGMVWHISKQNTTLPWYQKTFTGFDGEQTDPATGWQFLGASHRTYNLNQRYFVSEDPAGDGYAFGGNNPIMNSDPSGNSPKWLGTTMKVMGYVGTLGMAAFHKKWANIIGTTLVAALAVTGIGLSLYFGAPATPLLAATIGLTLDASTLSIASAAVPTNRGLNIASAIVGGMATIASLVMLGNAAVAGVSSLLGEGTAGSTISEFPVNATEGDIPATPPPDYSEAVAGNTRNIDTIKDALHNKLRRFIWHNTDTDEDIVRINSHKKIDQVWKILQRNFFSDNTKHIDKISALLMIGREIATNQAITLDDLALFFYELPDIHSPESGTLIQGNAFFTRNEIVSDLPAHAINDQRDFAFWNSSDEGRFGYMIKVRSNIWNVYDLSTDSIGFRSLRTNGLYNTTIFERHGINQFFTFQYIYRNVDPVDDDIGCLDILACACCVCWFICAVMTDFDEL